MLAIERLGKWQGVYYEVSDNQLFLLYQNQLFDQVGVMTNKGDIICEDEVYGFIGNADNSMVSLGNFELLIGSWPQKENEIVMESYLLDKLNISQHIGQTVKLSIRNNGEIVEKTYILSGVLKNYSLNWISEKSLISAFTKDPSLIQESKHVFVHCIEGYEDILDNLQVNNKYCLKNAVSTFPFQNVSNNPITFLLTCFMAISLIFTSYYSILCKQKAYLIMFREIGIPISNIMKSLIKESLQLSWLSALIVFPLNLLLLLFRNLLNINVSFSFVNWIISFFSLQICSVLGCLLASLLIKSITMKGPGYLIDSPLFKTKSKVTMTKLGLLHAWSHKIYYIIQLFCILLILFSSFSYSIRIYDRDRSIEHSKYMPDYVLRNTSSGSIKQISLNSIIEDINNFSGIKDMYTFYTSSYKTHPYLISWENMENSELLNELPSLSENGYIQGNITVVNNDVFLNRIINDIDIGGFDEKSFLNGESAIIILPKVQVIDENGSFQYYQKDYPNKDLKILEESSLLIGEEIHIKEYENKYDIQVTGIIEEYNDEILNYLLPHDPYHLIVSDKFNESLPQINTISIYLEEDHDGQVLDKQFELIASQRSGMILTNNRLSQELVQQNALSEYRVFSLIFGIILIVGLTIYLLISVQIVNSFKSKFELLNKFGISLRKAIWCYINSEIAFCFINVGLAIFGVLLIYSSWYVNKGAYIDNYFYHLRNLSQGGWNYLFLIIIFFQYLIIVICCIQQLVEDMRKNKRS